VGERRGWATPAYGRSAPPIRRPPFPAITPMGRVSERFPWRSRRRRAGTVARCCCPGVGLSGGSGWCAQWSPLMTLRGPPLGTTLASAKRSRTVWAVRVDGAAPTLRGPPLPRVWHCWADDSRISGLLQLLIVSKPSYDRQRRMRVRQASAPSARGRCRAIASGDAARLWPFCAAKRYMNEDDAGPIPRRRPLATDVMEARYG
jgi:hypothetical protein